MSKVHGSSMLPSQTEEQERITRYDEEVAKHLCMYIVDGQTLQEALLSAGLTKDVYYRWRYSNADFKEMIQTAMQERSWAQMEQCLEIADEASDDITVSNQGVPMINGKAIRRSELMINTRWKIMQKMLPKTFGDKSQMELTGADGKDLAPVSFNIIPVPQGQFISRDAAAAENAQDGGSDDVQG